MAGDVAFASFGAVPFGAGAATHFNCLASYFKPALHLMPLGAAPCTAFGPTPSAERPLRSIGCLGLGDRAAVFTVPVVPAANFVALAAAFSALVFFAVFFSVVGSAAATDVPFDGR